ncbi:MAG: hypothetical protein L3J03_03990 [Desulfobacterales bacterium]|nr:hypothetical protein [Desulfobacterales bacterium]
MTDHYRLAVVTINHGAFLCDNARQSFKAAAKRWGAAYVELTREDGPAGVTPLEHKLLLFEQVDADRIFYIDADAIIRNDAPSPFDICPSDKLGVSSRHPGKVVLQGYGIRKKGRA